MPSGHQSYVPGPGLRKLGCRLGAGLLVCRVGSQGPRVLGLVLTGWWAGKYYTNSLEGGLRNGDCQLQCTCSRTNSIKKKKKKAAANIYVPRGLAYLLPL